MTFEDGIRYIRYFTQQYVPSRPDVEEDQVSVFTSTVKTLKLSVEFAYKDFVEIAPIDVGLYSEAFPGYPVTLEALADPVAYGQSIPPELIVDFYYPEASDDTRATLIASFQDGDIDHFDFLHGWTVVAPQSDHPSADEVLYAIHASGHGDPELPVTDLSFDGLSVAELDFLAGVYVAALGRAPEHEGLAYWAAQLAGELERGTAAGDAFKALAGVMHASGTDNGETAAYLGDATYVDHLYASTLGRAPDAEGRVYWTGHLADGGARSEFVAVLLASALQSAGDDAYLAARIAVAKFVAQEHVSEDPQLIDLATVLDGVYNSATAWRTVRDVENGRFAVAPSEEVWVEPVAESLAFVPGMEPDSYDVSLIGMPRPLAFDEFDGF